MKEYKIIVVEETSQGKHWKYEPERHKWPKWLRRHLARAYIEEGDGR